MQVSLDWGREVCGGLSIAESREWLVTNGIGGYSSGTVAGVHARRYHGLLVAALKPPLGRTVLVSKLDERASYRGESIPLFANRWADGSVEPQGYRAIERFRLEGTTPVWTFAIADALLEKRIFMEQGENRTYVSYRLVRGVEPIHLQLEALVNYRDYHATTRGGGWQMKVEKVPGGVRVVAFEGARPFFLIAPGAEVELAHDWYYGFLMLREQERGLDAVEDQLHAGTFRARVPPGEEVTVILSSEESLPADALDSQAALRRRQRHEAELLSRWREPSAFAPPRSRRSDRDGGGAPSRQEKSQPSAIDAPGWVRQLVLAADQFVVRRPLVTDPEGMTVIAGYHWFGDWGRDTMISLPGLTLSTGRPEVARSLLTTFARFVDRGMLPNRFPDAGEAPEYNTVDATLWYFDALRAYHAATGDDTVLTDLFPVLEDIIDWHRRGTRYGIGEDPEDGLLRSGEAGVQLTWMDAKIGDWVVTPRTGKAVEINALWYNALRAMSAFAGRLRRPTGHWDTLGERVRASFDRFWNEAEGYCYDVIDGPEGNDGALRPNQIFTVSLPESPFPPEKQKQIVDACGRHLLASFGLRSLAPGHPQYRGRYEGGPAERDARYHQGAVWGWLLGPFVLAHLRVYGDVERARSFLEPMGHHLSDSAVGSLSEIFDGDAPFTPRGCIAQAWSVSETLRAWLSVQRHTGRLPEAGSTMAASSARSR